MVEERRLPVAHPLRDELVLVADVLEVVAREHLCGRVLVEEGEELGPKRLVFRAPSELHLSPDPTEPDAGVRNGSGSFRRPVVAGGLLRV